MILLFAVPVSRSADYEELRETAEREQTKLYFTVWGDHSSIAGKENLKL
jgi:hypothetical protein